MFTAWIAEICVLFCIVDCSNGENGSVRKSKEPLILSGHPELGNCLKQMSEAKEQYFLIKNGFSLTPIWSEPKEEEYYPYDAVIYTYVTYRWPLGSNPTITPREKFPLDKYTTKDGIIRFERFTATPGQYETTLYPKQKTKNVKINFPLRNTTCYFVVQVLKPVIVLEGGIYRKVPPNIEIQLNAKDSMNLDKPLNDKNLQSLRFNWQCTQKFDSGFCPGGPISAEPSLKIPAEHVTLNNVINVTLTVKTNNNAEDTVTQTIEVVNNAAKLRISCEKNCPPVTDAANNQMQTYFRAICEKNCDAHGEENYEWEIVPREGGDVFSFDYNKNTHFGRIGPKFIVSKDVLKPSTEYLVTLRLKNAPREGKTTMAVKYAAIPKVESCEIRPPSGKSLHTKFTLNCIEVPPPDKNNFYELYVDETLRERVLSGFYPDVFRISFLLPPSTGRKFTVRITKGAGPAIFKDVHPKVDAAAKGKTSAEALETYRKFVMGDGKTKSIGSLIASGNEEEKENGIKKFSAIVNELITEEPSNETFEFAKSVSYTVVNTLLKSPSESADQLILVSDALTNLIEHNELTKDDPLLAKLASSVCRQMVNNHAEEVKRQRFPLNSETQFNRIGNVMTRCFEANVKQNFDLLLPIKFNISVEEFPEGKLEEDIMEYYPNYIDFGDNYSDYLENLHAVTENIINASSIAAKSLALTTAIGEHFVKSSGKHSATLVAKDEGVNFPKTKIQVLDCILIPSKDFDLNDHPFDILVSLWTRDLMWWNHAKSRVATNIVNVQFWHSTCKKRIRNFKAPVNILMEVKNITNFDLEIVTGNVTVPAGYASITGRDLNPLIRVHRIGLPKHSVLHINFHNVTDRFEVVLKNFNFPSIEDFEHNTTVTEELPELRLTNYRHYDVWIYLGVLPGKGELTTPSTLFYNVSFTSSFCIRWKRNLRIWKNECQPGLFNTDKYINCECHHFSVIAGYVQNAQSDVQEVFPIEIRLELQSCHIIFGTLAVTVALYCLLILLKFFKKPRQIYFLADNNKDHLYAYLVVVRTENTRNAGTTSHVIIRLVGRRAASEPHVLNYPDPEMLLLQRQGQDTFVLTTEKYLGTVRMIELWYDCTGASPSWCCRDVVVYDLQKNRQWYFKVKSWLSVEKKGQVYVQKLSAEGDEEDSIIKKFRFCNHFHTWQLSAGENNFSYVARLTTVFSNILMIYMLVLAYLGIPTLEFRDSIDPYEKYYIPGAVVSGALFASFFAFLVHVTIAWVFRFSDIQFSALRKVYTKKLKVTIFCWSTLITLIVISTSFLLVYGFWVPVVSSLVWLTTCLLAILINIIVWENLLIVVQTFFCRFKLTLRLETKMDSYLKMIDTQRMVLYRKFDSAMLRPFISHLYRPLKAIQITRRRIVVKLRRGIYDDLEDLFMYGVYNIILYIVILVNKGILTTVSKAEVESMLQGEHTRTLAFSKIRALMQIYDYLNDTLIPTMQPIYWYENLTISSSGLMIDNANKFIGVARLRQHRLTTDVCVVPKLMKFMNVTCLPEFALSFAEDRTFGPRWTNVHPDAHQYDRLHSIWAYSTTADTATLAVIGRIATYGGGGYVAFLGRTLYNSYVNLHRLVEKFWIDHKMRSLFIEFLLYNANYNIFIAVSLLFEQSATGYTSSFTEINVVRMLFVENEVEIMTIIFFILFTFWVVLLMLKLSVGIIKNITTFYKRVWLMIDLVINVMSIICICMFILRMHMVEDYLNELEKVKHNEFVSYFSLLYVEDFLTYFAGILICIATARLWKFLRFGLFFRITERTLSMAAFPLFAVTFAFAVILTAFGLSGILIYGNEFPELSTFIKIVATLIQLSLKPDQFDLSDYLGIDVSYYYFALYLLLMQIILFVYIIVIIMAYMKAQLEFSVAPDSYTVGDYVQERFRYLPRLVRARVERMRGGEKEKSPVTPKADEFRYANSIGVQKSTLNSMRFIVSCIVRNMNQSEMEQAELTQHETEMMLGVCRQFVLKTYVDDEIELFFKGHFVGEQFQFVDEKRIDKMADFVRLMFAFQVEEEVAPKPDRKMVQCSKMAKQKNKLLRRCNLMLKLMVCQLNEAETSLENLFEDT